MTSRVGFLCDIGPSIGVGHVMRSLALAEELAVRGIEPVFLADAQSVPWAAEQIARRGFPAEQPLNGLDDLDWLTRSAVDAIVIDSYLLPNEGYRAVRARGLRSMAIVDGPLRSAEADLYLDQNVGSELDEVALPEGSTRLAGLQYALLRDEIRAHRPEGPPVSSPTPEPHVLAVFGGTDPLGVGPVAVEALARTRRPFRLTLVAPREELRVRAEEVPLFAGQSLHVTGLTGRLGELVRSADLVVSAAGSSAWDLLSLGSCAAFVVAADNQEVGYRRLVSAGMAAGLGRFDDLTRRHHHVVGTLATLLSDHRRRTRLARAAWRSVDGRGRERVADALLR